VAGAALALLWDGAPGTPEAGSTRLELRAEQQGASQQTASQLLGSADREEDSSQGQRSLPGKQARSSPATPPEDGEARISGFAKVGARPIGGVALSAIGPAGDLLASSTSRADGTWELYLRPDVAFSLRAVYALTVPFERQEPALAEGDMRRAGNLTLAAGRLVTGTIVDEYGDPITEAWAAVAQTTYTPAQLRGSVNGLGAMRLENTPLSALLEAGAPGFQYYQFLAGSKDERGSPLPDVPNAIVLQPGRSAAVFVHDSAGTPIAGANVQFIPATVGTGQSASTAIGLGRSAQRPAPGSPAGRHSQVSNEGGLARTNELGPGLYWAEVLHEDYTSAGPTRVPPVDEVGGDGAMGLDALLSARPRLRFQIVAPKGLPAGLHIRCTISGEEHRPFDVEATPIKSGGIVDKVVPEESDYTVRAWAPGFHVASIAVHAASPVAGPPSLLDAEGLPALELKPAGVERLTVVDAAGTPIEGATCQLKMEPAAFHPRGSGTLRLDLNIYDSNGWPGELKRQSTKAGIEIQTFASEDWPTLFIAAPGFQSARFDFDNWPESEAPGQLQVQLLQDAGVVITVLDKDGRPVKAAKVYLTLKTPQLNSHTTNQLGQVEIPGLAAGEASVMARGPGGELTQRESFELTLGKTTEIELTLR
jgi:hypothetical protein